MVSTLMHAPTDVELKWHISASHGQILASAFSFKSLTHLKLFPLRSEANVNHQRLLG